MIFVTMGSQKFQFDRLLKALDNLAEEGKIHQEIIAQTGACTYRPKHIKCEPFMDRDHFGECMKQAELIISHAGTGTIIKAVKAGKKIIVVPRLARYGEHVDDHQTEIADMFEELGMILSCRDCNELEQKINEIRDRTFRKYESNTETIIRSIDEYISGL